MGRERTEPACPELDTTYPAGMDADIHTAIGDRCRKSALQRGLRSFGWWMGGLTVVYAWVLWSLGRYVLREDLHSHVLLIPFVVAWLIHLERDRWPQFCVRSTAVAGVAALAGSAALAGAVAGGASVLGTNDFLALAVLSLLLFSGAGACWFLGVQWLKSLAFPVGMLLFMIPLPDGVVLAAEHFLMAASAEAVDVFFQWAGLPFLRDGQVFQLPGITLVVAQECSGIRSTWVLFITSIIASHLFLKSPWNRTLLVAVVIPLGILRNGFRVLVLGSLCVHQGPHMIHSALHHRGGPVFFVLSLIPLLLLLWGLRRLERTRRG